MRTIWNGSISFGLVNIPVGLALATQRQDVSFRTLHRACGTPIKQKRWCPVHERDVEPDELVKGWEVAKGQYVLVEEADLEAVALTRSQSIAILRFVRLEDGDPVFFDRTYYLAPDGPLAGDAYGVLSEAIKGKVGIGKRQLVANAVVSVGGKLMDHFGCSNVLIFLGFGIYFPIFTL